MCDFGVVSVPTAAAATSATAASATAASAAAASAAAAGTAAAATAATAATAAAAAGVGTSAAALTAAGVGAGSAAVGSAAAGLTTSSLLAYAGLASSLISAGVGALGSMQQGAASSRMAKYQAGVAQNNRIATEYMAKDAVDRGRIAEDAHRTKLRLMQGSQTASLAAQGTDISSGSPLDILTDTAQFGELDALTIRSNAAREAYGYRIQGGNFGAEAGLLGAKAANFQTAGMVGAASSLLSGAGSVGDKWLNYKSKVG